MTNTSLQTNHQHLFKPLPAKISVTAKGFTAIVSAESIDRDGEVLIPQGCNALEFLKNPTLFWNHDYSKPIGRCIKLKRVGSTIVGEFVFAVRPNGYEGDFFPEVASSLVAQGVVNAVSVGYFANASGTRKANIQDKKKYGNGVNTIYSRWKLFEISLAPLQANPDAVITAVRKGFCSKENAKKLFGVVVPNKKIPIEVFVSSIPTERKPINIKSLVAREFARAKGQLWLD
tara:strand:+ start:666 stop:1358 length:693 start_codon:yes stop_codon:yes gene_type:complete